MIILVWHGYFLWKTDLSYHIYFKFYNDIFVQFGKQIKILRSDNAFEYTQNVVDSFCVDHGILHQTRCAHTSPQNGVAKRKYRHVLDVARTLLFNMHVPRHFWHDAIFTACYLINRMPSVILNQKVSFSLLYPHVSPFPLTPWVFGCVAVCSYLGSKSG